MTTSEQTDNDTTVSREELYRQVWQEPMTKVARAVLVCALTLAAWPALAQDTDRLNNIARDAARRFEAARTADAQARQAQPAPPPGATVNMTLDEATERALERNLDIAVERLNPQTFDFSIASSRGQSAA